jgi:hypothetical protein
MKGNILVLSPLKSQNSPKVRESRGRPIHRWNRAELYFTASSRYTTEVFYCYKLRGRMSFFRANLTGLKADRDKKEIGTTKYEYYR